MGCQPTTKYGEAGCGKKLTIRIGELEEQVLAALKDDMLWPDVVEAFVQECVAESTRLARERDRGDGSRCQEFRDVNAGIERLTAAVVKAVDASLIREELDRLGRSRPIQLPGDLYRMLAVAGVACGPNAQKSRFVGGAFVMVLVAGTGFDRCRTRFHLLEGAIAILRR